ncbi:MAG: DUF4491 family protein [Bacteroidaceae bacterium]|nr:DUF4491 family protein [Bacteroidaceae bacterium]
MHFTGILIGLATFLTIGIFHPLVIKAEYYFGRRSWWAFLMVGIAFFIASLLTSHQVVSIFFGVVSFSALWGIHEVFQQHNRVKRGWFPMNPKRKDDYKD